MEKNYLRYSKLLTAIVSILIVLGIFFLVRDRGGNMLKIHFIDVGCGDAILFELPDGKFMLIDSGSKQYAEHVRQYLTQRNITEIDTAILTHPHYDHFEGFDVLVDHFPINNFYTNGDERNPHEGYFEVIGKIKAKGIEPVVIREGMELYPDDKNVFIKILHPQKIEGSTNENAIVTWLVYGKTSFLFMSDIQVKQQERIIELFPEIQAADCIQVPHHGGRVSDSFVALSKDRILIVSTGKNYRGEEKPIAAEISKLQGNLLYRTDKMGDITLVSNGRKVSLIHGK